MLTPEKLRGMTPRGRGREMERLATIYYRSEKFVTQLARDFDVNMVTVYRWRQSGPPWAVLYALEAWVTDLNPIRAHTWAARTAIAVLQRALDAPERIAGAEHQDEGESAK